VAEVFFYNYIPTPGQEEPSNLVLINYIMPSNATNAEVFIYTGPGGVDAVHRDLVRVRVDPSVTSIPAYAFKGCNKLTEVELCEGLVEIGVWSFADCGHSIKKIHIPTSLRRIGYCAFDGSLQCPILLHDGIESIGAYAFNNCIFTNFRVPPLITVTPEDMLYNCTSIFSVEIPLTVMEIGSFAFNYCYCLRNLALPPNAVIGDIFGEQSSAQRCDLYQLFSSIAFGRRR
jgi:hypothetical protein